MSEQIGTGRLTDDELASEFIQRRRCLGLSLRQVAEQCGASFNTLSRIERGRDFTASRARLIREWLAEHPAPCTRAASTPPAEAAATGAVEALDEALRRITSSFPLNGELRYDGTPDPQASAYVEGLNAAHDIVAEVRAAVETAHVDRIQKAADDAAAAIRAAVAASQPTAAHHEGVRVGFRYRDGEILSLEREAMSEDIEVPVAVIDTGDGEWLTLSELRDQHMERLDAALADTATTPTQPHDNGDGGAV